MTEETTSFDWESISVHEIKSTDTHSIVSWKDKNGLITTVTKSWEDYDNVAVGRMWGNCPHCGLPLSEEPK